VRVSSRPAGSVSGREAAARASLACTLLFSQGQHLCERIAILMIFIWLERPRAGDVECERVSGQWPLVAAVEAAKVYRYRHLAP
jgi:hypothetical protein